MTTDIKKRLKKVKPARSYIARDLSGFRADLLNYARTYFPDNIQDFSEASLGGMLLDFAAMVGDSMSFYADHQFNELDWRKTIERKNLHRHIENAGIKIPGPSPSVAEVDITISIPAALVNGEYVPDVNALPVILKGTTFTGGPTRFSIIDDVDFSELDGFGNIMGDVTVESIDPVTNNPTYFLVTKTQVCISGTTSTITRIVGSPQQFLKIPLGSEASEVISVFDSEGNEYYEVEYLSQDTVFAGLKNYDHDHEVVEYAMGIRPAPYRFETNRDINTRSLTLTFGSGNAESLEDDIIPDPSELALPLYGKNVVQRFSLDPNRLLTTDTLGVAPSNTTLTIIYREGGNYSHNVGTGLISEISQLNSRFPVASIDIALQKQILDSIRVTNRLPAAGGAPAPTLDELRNLIPNARQQQSRIVSKEDLISRIYTMPSKFGRVFRASVRPNPNNHLSSQLFIISKDAGNKLALSSDTLKKNISTYLNEFRLISDAIDVLDARVINFKVDFNIVVDPNLKKEVVVQKVIRKLADILRIKNFQIDQPILLIDIMHTITSQPGVLSLLDLNIENITTEHENRLYSDVSFNMSANTFKGMIIAPAGSIFELRYPSKDITGIAT